MSELNLKNLDTNKRALRVRRLKKAIVATVLLAILIPVILSIVFGVKVYQLEKELAKLKEEYTTTQNLLKEQEMVDSNLEKEQNLDKVPTVSASEIMEETNQEQKKKVYLTFDDGPSVNTNAILDVLKKYQVKATFFVVGKTSEEDLKLYQRIVNEGHSIGIHSYSHKYDEIYQSVDSFTTDLNKMQDLIFQTTGTTAKICRFPGGSSNEVSTIDMEDLITYLQQEKITYYDWNVSSQDAAGESISANQIAANVIVGIDNYHTSIVLLHDGADKQNTVLALPMIIEALQARDDVVLLPITEETEKVQHITIDEVLESGGQ